MGVLTLPQAEDLEHVLTQWASVHSELLTIAHPQIGSICDISPSGDPVLGRLSYAASQALPEHGPFSTSADFFLAHAEGTLRLAAQGLYNQDSSGFIDLGVKILTDIVRFTVLFADGGVEPLFLLNHADLKPCNILVDEDLNFLAVIDWQFAQTAPWAFYFYPDPFPFLWTDQEIHNLLRAPDHHPADATTQQRSAARLLFTKKLRETGPLGGRLAETLESEASKIFGCYMRLGDEPAKDEECLRAMVRLGFGLDEAGVDGYLAAAIGGP